MLRHRPALAYRLYALPPGVIFILIRHSENAGKPIPGQPDPPSGFQGAHTLNPRISPLPFRNSAYGGMMRLPAVCNKMPLAAQTDITRTGEPTMNMKKWLATALACSAIALSGCGNSGGTQQASQPADANAGASGASAPGGEKVLRVATNAEFAPFESKNPDGSLSGFDIDLINAMAKEAGYRVEFKDQAWDSLFNSLNNGDVDAVAAAVTITPERQQNMLFTEPYFEITQVVAMPEGKQVASVEDLKNLNRIGVVTGNTGDLAASKLLGATNPKIARFETLPLLLKELQNGGVDAAVSDSSVVMEFIKHNGDKGFAMIKVPDFEAEHYGIALRQSDTELRDTLNKALAAVKASGEYDRIHQQYFGSAAAAK